MYGDLYELAVKSECISHKEHYGIAVAQKYRGGNGNREIDIVTRSGATGEETLLLETSIGDKRKGDVILHEVFPKTPCYRILTCGVGKITNHESPHESFYRMEYPEALLMLSSDALWEGIPLYDSTGVVSD